MLGIAASEAGPPLGVVVGLVIITFIFVRSRWVGIRFRWDEAAAARRRRAAAHARAAGGSVGVGLAEDVTPGQHSGEARATPTVGLELPGAARERGGDTAGSDVLPAREVVLEPQPVEPQPSSRSRSSRSRSSRSRSSRSRSSRSRSSRSRSSRSRSSRSRSSRSRSSRSRSSRNRSSRSRSSRNRSSRSRSSRRPVEPQPDVANDGEPVPIPDYTRDPFLGDPLFGVPAAKRPPRDEPTE